MGYMSHVSSVTREVELKISVLLILKTTLHVWFPKMAIFVKKRLRWKQSEQRREYLFLTLDQNVPIKNHKYNFYKCTFKNYKSHSA